MAEDILRLKVESKEYDSKLKRAAEGLTHYIDNCRQAGNTLDRVEKETLDYVKAVGRMDSVSRTATGKLGEMKKTFVELSAQYKSLTDAEKASPFGKAISSSLDQLRPRITEAKQQLDDINRSMGVAADSGGGGLFAGMSSKMSGALQVFGGNMLTKAAGAVADLGSEMYGMVQQGIALARQGEGIRNAFERLGRGDILDGLRKATHGTVTDIELMKAAVKFNDFKLPLDELGTMLAFAQQKAKDTGESVDYMVDSIVTGLGRKSLMILDNLGLSATEVKDKMAETGDMTKAVGAIIREQMSKAGDYVETAADRAAQANVDMQNKMEELGRKFAPVEEASNQLWASIKIGILDIVGGPLARLLNDLTEAGRLKNTLNDLNGTGDGGKETHTQKALRILREYSGGSKGAEGKQDLYNRQVASYTRQEEAAWRNTNKLREELKGLYKQQREGAQGLNGLISDTAKNLEAAENRAKALQMMRSEYQKGAKDILKPATVDIDTSGAVQSVETLKVKLKELEAQRKKAVVSGDDDRVKTLTQQINQTKTNIKALSPNELKTTNTATPQERAASKVSEAERTYTETLLKNSIRLEAGIDSTLENKKKELSAQERLFDAYNDAYATYKDPKYKEASAAAAEKIKQLAAEVKTSTDAQEAAKKSARELESAQKKLADAQQKLADAQATGSATAVYKAQKDVDKQQEAVNRLQNPTLPQPAKPTGFEALKQSVQAEIKFDQMQVDENTLHSLLQTALKNGLDGLTVDYSGLQERIAKGIDIPDSTWETLQEEINTNLKDLGIEPIKIDFKTGDVKEMTKDWKSAASAIQSVGSAMTQIEDPAAKVMGTIAQAIATMALSYAEASKQAAMNPANAGWGWIAFAATGVATMISSIAAIKNATGYATGGQVKGNTYSGDNIPIMVNAGETVLTAAMSNTLASAIQERGQQGAIQIEGRLSGEYIYLSAGRYTRRSGRGEIVTFKS